MSIAFVREKEGGEAFEDLPDRPISPHPNYVTAEGLAFMEGELDRLHTEHAAAVDAGDKAAIARTNRDLRYWTARRGSAEVVQPAHGKTVHFGSKVTIERQDGRSHTYRIVGEDEADPSRGTLSYVSPLARALTGKKVGQVVTVNDAEAEITAIS